MQRRHIDSHTILRICSIGLLACGLALLTFLFFSAVANAEVKSRVATDANGTDYRVLLSGDSPIQICLAHGYLNARCSSFPLACGCPSRGCTTQAEQEASLPTQPSTEATCASYARRAGVTSDADDDAVAHLAAIDAGLCPKDSAARVPTAAGCSQYVRAKLDEVLAAWSFMGRTANMTASATPPPKDIPGDIE
jgi:hypothetical protein